MSTNGTAAQTLPEDESNYYRIGEVSRLTEVKPFVLRYWESEFPMLEPVKSPSGHRLYRQEDLDMVFKIKRLLYDEGPPTALAATSANKCASTRAMVPLVSWLPLKTLRKSSAAKCCSISATLCALS